ncbi:MAG: glycosyltransferase 87 family protein, partial [Jatrophihabitans sp.]|uniref:glycosyltransferase 87 family protein n=1 Tax=Jatrophihabitans sp. TaxID=1932789 RepID=UPI003F7E6928
MPRWLAMTLMTLLSTAALLVTVRLCAPRLFADARRTWSALAPAAAIGLAEPVHATLHDGQVGLLLMGLVVIDVLVLRDTRWAGVLIGVAAAIKLTPAAFVLLLAAQRRWGAVCTAAVTFLVTAGVAAALLPHDSHRFWTKEVFGSGHIGETARLDNQSWNGFWQRLLGHTHTAAALWGVCAAATAAAGYWLARRLVVRNETVLALGVVGVTGCLVSPVSWTHHWVWWVPVLLGLAARPGRKRLVVATAAVMVIGASRDAFKPLYRPTVGEVTLGYWYLWAAVVKLIAHAVRQQTDPRETEPPGLTLYR